jgi:hypothetical protein
MADKASYHLKGILLGACNCDWGCPCNFEVAPSYGFCEGGYVWHVQEGRCDGVSLAGVTFAWCGHSPGPLHQGNLTAFYCIDDRTESPQRGALEKLIVKTPDAVPFGIFMSLTSDFLGVRYAKVEAKFDGVRSRVRIQGLYELELTPMKNPVTGENEPATLLKPNGFTSKHQELCTTSTMRLSDPKLNCEHAGKYGEYSLFEYKPV